MCCQGQSRGAFAVTVSVSIKTVLVLAVTTLTTRQTPQIDNVYMTLYDSDPECEFAQPSLYTPTEEQ
jgi:hypothetical protein